MRSGMQHAFSQVPTVSIPRSTFDRSHNYKTTLDSGWLVPVFLDEALPGDTFNLNMTTFCRLSTPLHPFMDNLHMDAFFFAVPYRLLWNHFVNMFGEQANPGDSTSFLVPTMTSPVGGYLTGSLQDYMGLPVASATAGVGVNPANTITHSALFTRAYNKVYNEWFRDQNLQNSVVVDVGDGPDNPANYVLLRRGKRHDYFTSALPWPQKGPAVNIPLGGQAPVTGIGFQAGNSFVAGPVNVWETGKSAVTAYPAVVQTTNPGLYARGVSAGGPSAANTPQIYADLTQATAATINQLRQAFQIQRIYERDARGGTRYTELIQAHFGVVSPDARLQRPEYLGGGSSPVNVNPIAQTGPSGTTGSSTPQGNLTGVGTSSMRGAGFTKSFTEHSIVIGLVSVRADMNYQQGLNRMWSRSSRFDFYWPALSHIGEQAILNQELYARGDANDTLVYGYQERFGEYRYKPSLVTGQFRSAFAQTLDSWHLAQTFTTLPTLSPTFIVENPPVARVSAVPSQPHFLFDSHFEYRCARPMPVYGVPGEMDRF
ncbi:major capsid protein [Blackfly microvirus SF02]|uniref:Major capsid protein n=1 Tax=Blackfly microvirus SF02 TaxID=2576452 RepID=A0A4P8PKA3_9VIRU|nr:major capsid protein [Blackfly microvirus SF02]